MPALWAVSSLWKSRLRWKLKIEFVRGMPHQAEGDCEPGLVRRACFLLDLLILRGFTGICGIFREFAGISGIPYLISFASARSFHRILIIALEDGAFMGRYLLGDHRIL